MSFNPNATPQSVDETTKDSMVRAVVNAGFALPTPPDSATAWNAISELSFQTQNRLVAIGESALMAAYGEALRDTPLIQEGCEEGLTKTLRYAVTSKELTGAIMERVNETMHVDAGAFGGCLSKTFFTWIGTLCDDAVGARQVHSFLVELVAPLLEIGTHARRQIIPPKDVDTRSTARAPKEEAMLLSLQMAFKNRRDSQLLQAAASFSASTSDKPTPVTPTPYHRDCGPKCSLLPHRRSWSHVPTESDSKEFPVNLNRKRMRLSSGTEYLSPLSPSPQEATSPSLYLAPATPRRILRRSPSSPLSAMPTSTRVISSSFSEIFELTPVKKLKPALPSPSFSYIFELSPDKKTPSC